MKISRARFDELGLGCEGIRCEYAEECPDCCEKPYEIAGCLDEQRLREEMTEEEYDAFRHNRMEVED